MVPFKMLGWRSVLKGCTAALPSIAICVWYLLGRRVQGLLECHFVGPAVESAGVSTSVGITLTPPCRASFQYVLRTEQNWMECLWSCFWGL